MCCFFFLIERCKNKEKEKISRSFYWFYTEQSSATTDKDPRKYRFFFPNRKLAEGSLNVSIVDEILFLFHE